MDLSSPLLARLESALEAHEKSTLVLFTMGISITTVLLLVFSVMYVTRRRTRSSSNEATPPTTTKTEESTARTSASPASIPRESPTPSTTSDADSVGAGNGGTSLAPRAMGSESPASSFREIGIENGSFRTFSGASAGNARRGTADGLPPLSPPSASTSSLASRKPVRRLSSPSRVLGSLSLLRRSSSTGSTSNGSLASPPPPQGSPFESLAPASLTRRHTSYTSQGSDDGAATNGSESPRMPGASSLSAELPSVNPISSEASLAELNELIARVSECPICFSALYREWTAVCVDREGVRVCPHFFHERCLRSYRGSLKCVVCGVPFTFRRRVPNVDANPMAWFRVVDLSGDGRLSKRELVLCLTATFPVDVRKLEKFLDRHWSKWDPEGRGGITLEHFIRPGSGFLAAFEARKRKLAAEVDAEGQLVKHRLQECPDIRDDPLGWFDFWDANRSRTLDQDELRRGLIKSFGLSSNERQSLKLTEFLRAVWPVFASGGGEITREDFLTPKTGLGFVIQASLGAR